MLDWKQSLLLLFNPWVERGNSGSTRRAALPLDYRARYFRVHPTLILWDLEQERACSLSSQMRTSLSLPRVLSLPGQGNFKAKTRLTCRQLLLSLLNTCVQPPPHRNYLHRQDYTSTISPRENLSSIQSLWSSKFRARMVIVNFKNSRGYLEACTAIVSKWPYTTNFRSYNNAHCDRCGASFYSNAERRSLSIWLRWCRAKLSLNVKLCRWIVERKFLYLAEPLPAKNLKRHLPRSPGYVNVYRYFFLFEAALNSNICFSSP